jgi:hypothetical protein
MRSVTTSLFLFFTLPVMAQMSPQQIQGTAVVQNPSAAGASGTQTINGPIGAPSINTILYASPGTSTVSPLIAANPSGNVEIVLPCGTYLDNLVVTGSNIIFQGGGVNCVYLQPRINVAVLSINASSSNTIQYIQMRDMTLQNQGGFTSDGIDITGPPNQINDWHHLENVRINGFEYGVNIIGRTIWTTFDNVHIGDSLNTGLYTNSASAIYHFVYRGGQINNSQSYGVYWVNTNPNVSQSIIFDHVNIEDNGLSGTQTNCAGLYMNGVGSGQYTNGYMEANCVANPDQLGADVRLDGTYVQAFDVRSSLMWSTTNFSIYNTAVQSTGLYEGNRFGGSTNIKVATSNRLSNIIVGPNFFSAGNIYAPDSGGNDHVTDLTAAKKSVTAINSVTNNTIPVTNQAYLEFLDGTFTVNTMTGGYAGQVLTIAARTATSVTLTNSSSTNGFSLPNGATVVLPTGSSADFIQGGDGFWRLLGPTASTSLTDASTIEHSSPTVTPGQLACIKAAGPPPIIGTCTAVSGATCTSCN